MQNFQLRNGIKKIQIPRNRLNDTLLTEKSASLHPVRRSHLPKLTPWRPSKCCNPAIRRGVLKKSPKGLVAHSDWAGPCSEKQPAAPSLDELWNCICSGKHVGRRVESYGTDNSRVR